MISLEKLPEGQTRLGFWLGHGWHWEQFDTLDELYIYAHKNGICMDDCDIMGADNGAKQTHAG
jgi:hypothetical protein